MVKADDDDRNHGQARLVTADPAMSIDKPRSCSSLTPMLRTLFFAVVLGSATLFYYYTLTSSPNTTIMSDTEWSSAFAEWHRRALSTPHPKPHDFTPTSENLLLAVLLNAQVEHEGITLTLFAKSGEENGGGSVAVDASGRVLLVSEKDTKGILDLSKEALGLPQTGRFRNTWVIHHVTTSQPIHRLLIPTSGSSSDLHEVSVQGFSKEKRELAQHVEGISLLPKVLWELVGLVLEARGDTDGERRDEVVLGKVREIMRPYF